MHQIYDIKQGSRMNLTYKTDNGFNKDSFLTPKVLHKNWNDSTYDQDDHTRGAHILKIFLFHKPSNYR